MLRRKTLLILAVVAAGIVACYAHKTTVELRVENVSPLDFEDVTVQGVSFGDLAAGETSGFRPVELTFRYALMELTANGRRVNAQSLNFGGRRFTHRVEVRDLERGHLGVWIVRH